MTYTVKEIFRTLQGEGAHTGRVAVFCRFAGCNLWSGREEDRATAQCTFCDTDFVGGEKYKTADELADAIACTWGDTKDQRFVVLTGGEPLLQVDREFTGCLKDRGFTVALETNGTQPVPDGIDWVCVSPKNKQLRTTFGDELKLVYPQKDLWPDLFSHLAFKRFSLSPMDGPNLKKNTQAAVEYCLAHPQWRLTLQIHKLVGIR